MIYLKKFKTYDDYLEYEKNNNLSQFIAAIVGLKRTFFKRTNTKSIK